MNVHERIAELPRPPIAVLKPIAHVQHKPQKSLLDTTLPALFMLIFLIQLSRHELWRDELNAWAIAVASPTLNSLFAKLHYEGHPALWYLLLWFVSRFSPHPVAMKTLEAAIGMGAYVLIGSFSPFSRVEKVLLFLGYFVSFEYTVLSRTYSICFLILLVYLYRRCKCPEHLLFNTVLLGVMANCDMIGLILSIGLFGEYVWDRVDESKRRGVAFHRRLSLAGFTYCSFLAFALWTIWPAPDISWRTTGHILEGHWQLPRFFAAAVNYLVVPWYPISNGFPHHFWNTNLRDHQRFYTASLPFVLTVLFFLFRRTPRLLAVLGVTAFGAIVFGALIYMGGVRNFGILFMVFIAALWIQRPAGTASSVLKYVFLGASAIAGLQAGIAQWNHPFSNSGATARWMRLQHLDGAMLVGTPDTSIAAVAEQLNRPAYFLDCSCWDTFLLFADRRDNFTPAQMPDRLAEAARHIPPADMVLILVHPLSSAELTALARRSLFPVPLAHFMGSELPEEDFYLYRLQAPPAT